METKLDHVVLNSGKKIKKINKSERKRGRERDREGGERNQSDIERC